MVKKIFDFSTPRLCTRKESLSKDWYVEYYLIDQIGQKQRFKVYKNINKGNTIEERKAIASVIIDDLLFALNNNTLQEKNTKQIFDVLSEVLNEKKPLLRKKSYLSDLSKIKRFYAYTSQHNIFEIKKITSLVAQKFVTSLIQELLRPTTINSIIIKIRHFFDILVQRKTIQENPFTGIKLLQESPQGAMYFKDHQIPYIKETIQKENPLLWLACQTLFYCFIRPGEMRNLLVEDFDLIEATVTIRADISKNKKTQTVLIPDGFINELRSYLIGKDPKAYFLTMGDKQLTINYLNTEHRKIMDNLGFGKRYVFYSWKHTGAVKVAKSGVPLKQLQMQLRHHSLDQVNEYLREMGLFEAKELKENFPSL